MLPLQLITSRHNSHFKRFGALVVLELLDDSKSPATCTEWRALRAAGYEPATTVEDQSERATLFECGTLFMLKQAQPAQQSYLRDLVWNAQLLTHLPPTLGCFLIDDDQVEQAATKAAAAGQSWSDFDPKAQAESHGPRGVLITQGANACRTLLDVTAWGDFNQDGLDDVVVLLTHRDPLGSLLMSELVLLTRRSAKGRLEVIQHWKP